MPTPASAPERILQRLDWQVVRRLDGLLQGDYRSLFRGQGIDLADLREYQPGDDVRAIDWNVTARMDVPYVREYNEDREITAWFLLDLSPSRRLRDGRGGPPEAVGPHRLRECARAAADPARQPRRRGALRRPASARRSRRGAGATRCCGSSTTCWSQPQLARAPATDLRELLDRARRQIKRRSLVFVISDFISVPGWERSLELLDPPPRGARDPARRSAGARAAGPGADDRRGRRDRRAAVRRHARSGLPASASRRPSRRARRALALAFGGRASMR